MNNKCFRIFFSENLYEKNEIILNSSNQKMKVISKPGKTWYRVLLQYCAFGIYKAPITYKVKLINK